MLYRGTMENTPAGRLIFTAEDDYLIRLDFEKPTEEEIDKYLTKWYGSYTITPGLSAGLVKAMAQVEEYFSGKRKAFDLEVKMFGTDFYKACWKALCDIPYGETISYKQLADRVNSPKGFRAVGQANHHNPISIIVPCHRVVTYDSKLGGYGGGLDKKKMLLEHELKNK